MPPDSLYEVRLNATAKTPSSGIVEILIDGCWRTICYTLSTEALNVICKQMGYKEALIPNNQDLPNGFECKGDEENLVQCPHRRDWLSRLICFPVPEGRTIASCTRKANGYVCQCSKLT